MSQSWRRGAIPALLVIQQLVAASAKSLGKPVLASIIEFCFIPAFSLASILLIPGIIFAFGLEGVEALYLAGAALSIPPLFMVGAGKIAWLRPIRKSANIRSIRRSHAFAIIELFGYLSAWSSLLVMPFLLSVHDVGIFNAMLRIAGIVTLISISIPSVFTPRPAKALYDRDRDAERNLTRMMRLVMLGGAISFFAGVVIFGKLALGLFGQDFVSGYTPLLICSAGLCGVLALGPAGEF